MLHQFKTVLDREFNANMEKVGEETKKTLAELERIKASANKRFESYYNRKKWTDYIIFGYIALTPIFLGIIACLLMKILSNY